MKKLSPSFLSGLFFLFFSSLFIFNNRGFFRQFSLPPLISWHDLWTISFFPPLVLSFLSIVLIGIGSLLLTIIDRQSHDSEWESVLLSFALGTGALGTLLHLMGLAGKLSPAWILPIVFLAFLRGIQTVRSYPYRLWVSKLNQQWTSLSPLELLFAGFILWGLLNGLLNSLVPPYDIDSLSYHLAIPKNWLEQGKISLVPWMIHAQYPLHAETLYSLSLLLGIDTVSQGLHWLFGVATVSLLLFWPDLKLKRVSRLFAAACFSTLPVVTHFIWRAHNDLAMAFYGFLMCCCLHRSMFKGNTWLVLAGLSGGWMASVRYQGLAFLLVTGAVTLLFLRDINKKKILLFTGIALLIASPWYIRNWIWTGNPVWPYLSGIFPTPHWSEGFNNIFHTYFSRGWNPLKWFQIDWLSLWKPNTAPLASHYFLVPLCFLIVLHKRPWPKFFAWTALSGFIYFGFVMNIRENWWRFLLVLLPSACWLSGWLVFEATTRFSEKIRWTKWIAALILIPGLFIRFYFPPTAIAGLRDPQKPQENARHHFLKNTLPSYHDAWEFINNHTPPQSKIGLYQDSQGYYLERDYVWIDPMAQGAFSYDHLNAGQIYKKMKEMGITHLLFGPEYQETSSLPLPRIHKESSLKFDRMVQLFGHKIHETPGGAKIYELKSVKE